MQVRNKPVRPVTAAVRSDLKRRKVNQAGLYSRAVAEAFVKLNPLTLYKNPVMFVVLVGTAITLALTVNPDLFGDLPDSTRLLNGLITAILFLTVLFGNFAEAVAEGRGKAQADALRRTRQDTSARRVLPGGRIEEVYSTQLRKGDVIRVVAGDLIPADGEVLEGVASVDESAITGESAPVIKEPGSDVASTVTGGTRILSDELLVQVGSNPGEGFIDRMIALVEGARRQKTPNEIALTVLLAVLTLIFLIVVATIPPMANFVGAPVSIAALVGLLVALIPTTIGGLLSAIGIAGMDRVAQFNVIATSGKAVEAAGDVGTLILDKTGTITLGNRLADEFIPVGGHSLGRLAQAAWAASIFDTTPEGKSVVKLATAQGAAGGYDLQGAAGIEFTAQTRMSGTDFGEGRRVRKGAVDAVKRYVQAQGGAIPADLDGAVERVSRLGGTPLAVSDGTEIFGIIYLKDIVKPGIRERFEELRRMGVRTVMLTGDNRITASVIAGEAGVDDFIAEATPEDKIRVIRESQEQGKLVAMTGDGTNDAPALAQADVGVAMNSGTQAAKEAANMVDLDSDPTKLIDVVTIGKQLLITRGALTTFSIANDVSKYFALIPAMFGAAGIGALNIMALTSPQSAILSALIFNALIIPALIPLALRGVEFRPLSADQLLTRNILIYGLGGLAVPFVGIKLIDIVVTAVGLA
ncbi:potassium-transporting ATPase subunit KdpB [Gloeobacter morelensis]|uniref:Potassium-transporting ATPase ATP-binding subunit n=1 Tax=Gloeobacter morelensis MG652769 TaxID=2781736 RepID=A0ABY3PIQ0_9CYAN|nr:potassium-transporting ATPase subunit KdpB [Gloeobacter morelensis]UFP93417.1 potassium-transporting ATPase subunit KdpB [Gloeobacter morelensis MG652769]